MAIKPWMTSDDLLESVKRKISFPTSQQTFSNTEILAFLNEEMFIAQVPSVLSFHEDYFTHYDVIPLVPNVSRYPIPDRAIGMKVRDMFWMDQTGNLFEMTRILEHDRAFFQINSGSNQAIHKFFIEGNYIVCTPSVVTSPTGSLVIVYYLRPNQLVDTARAATIVGFNQQITINNSLIQALDTVSLGSNIFTAVNTLGGTITAITSLSTSTTQVTCSGHQLSTGQSVTISSSNSNPSVDGTWVVTVTDVNNFTIQKQIATNGTSGTFTCVNQFQIGTNNNATAANLNSAIISSGVITSSSVNNNIVTLLYPDITMSVTTSRTTAFLIPSTTLGIQFSAINSTYTNPDTNVTENLFVNTALVDLLQTKPGHQTYVFNVEIPTNGISGNSVYFNLTDLKVPSGTISSGIVYQTAPIEVGDYMCLANECIIPQIPPDLHNGLAERGSARILAALGDQQGLQASMAKIQEIEQRQGNLLDNRAESNPQKVVNRNSILRYQKLGVIRRF